MNQINQRFYLVYKNERMNYMNTRPQISYVPRDKAQIPDTENPKFLGRNSKVENDNLNNNTMNDFEKLLLNRNQTGIANPVEFLYQKEKYKI